jgi:hypothetical protein
MKTNTFLKGLIITIAALIGVQLQTGFPTTNIQWIIFGFTILGTILTYAGQHAWFPSNSSAGTIHWLDLIYGAFVALGAGVSDLLTTLATATVIDWTAIGKLFLSVLIGYIVKTFATNTDGQLMLPDK